MDTKIEKKSSKLKIILLVLGALLLVGVFANYYITQKNIYNVKQDDLQIETVLNGNFEDMMMITAQTQSLSSSLVNVTEGGAVKEIFVEDGKIVTKGQSLARIYNPNTEFNLMNQETGIMQQISQMRNTVLDLKNQEFNQDKELLLTQNEYNIALQNYNLQKRLYQAEIGKQKDFEIAEQNLNYYQKRKDIVEKGMVNEKKSRSSQIQAVYQSIEQMEKSLHALRGNKNNFLILAPASGRLSSFSLSLGQGVLSGQSIGKVDLMDGYKLVAKIDEYYINKLRTNIKGTIQSNGKHYSVIVSKILPEVDKGQFSAELVFENHQPKNLRIGMTFGIKLKLSEDTKSLMIAKGNFYKDTNGQWIYVLEKNKAVKKQVQLGRENLMYYEVLSGLKEGEEVVVSDYSNFKKFQILNITK